MDPSDLYLAAIVESSDDAIISKDLDGAIRTVNAAAERMFGYTAAEIVGKPVLVLIPPERHGEESLILSRLRRGERIDHYETVRVAKDGRRIDVSLTVSPVRDASGTIIGASKVARDITERKRAAAALAAQQDWFRITLNSIGDAVIASDQHGRVLFLNHRAERLTGWSQEEAQGRSLVDVFRIVKEDTREAVEDPVATVLRLGQVIGLGNHTVLISREGAEWPIGDSAAPIVDRDGAIIGVVVVFREVTDERRDEELARSAAAERDRLLRNERMARSDAERANRLKDDFVAMVSHELRTPLNAILGWTELLSRQDCDPGTREHGLEVIARSTRLQAQLISDLLDVSRIVSGKLRLELENVDLAEVIGSAVVGLQFAAASKGIEVITRLDPRSSRTVGDPARLHQIFWNLVSNAIKFTSRGGTVAVDLRLGGDRAEITVTDTGIGIRPEVLPDIFERFRQDRTSTTHRHGGLGLGLSISKHLTELHGGTVRAWSAGENQGSTFTVELPLRPEQSSEQLAQVRHSKEAALEAVGVSLRGVKVLVVEDDQDTRDLVRRLLEAHRAVVFAAVTAAEALEILPSARPDIIVSDIGLPEMDGCELIRRVRQLDSSIANVPAVALTAFARYQDRGQVLRAGFNAHVAKPVEPADLVITVGSFVNLIRSRQDK